MNNSPPTLVDIDSDGDLEIVAGNDSGLLHILHHDGSEMASFNTGDDIRGGISVADLNDEIRMFETSITINILGYLIGEGENDDRELVKFEENFVEVTFPREVAPLPGSPSFFDD